MQRFLTPRTLIILGGLIFGALGAFMVNWGNPPNMGICVACFIRDIAGALSLHQASVVQYTRPEIIGFVLGALITAFSFGEWRARGGSSPIIRFVLGACVMIGALVFLGCPIRMMLRIAGGDLNGITALTGMVVGVLVGIFFLKRGFNLGRSIKIQPTVGWIMPALMVGLLLFAIFQPSFLSTSEEGPGARFVPLWVALLVGLGKAANMKLTFDKESSIIVNSSGGGCPDIPVLYTNLVEKKLTEVPRPKDIGFTLCARMLDRALEECIALWKGGE